MPRALAPTLAVVLAATAAACAVDQPTAAHRRGQPLIGGAVDDADPGAVALLFGTGTDAFCTGTLISPSVVLTAAHCIDMFSGDPDASVFFGTDTQASGARIGMADTQRHLGWTGSVGENDVGLVRLSLPADPLLAIRLNQADPAGFVDQADAYRHIGFGKHDPDGPADGKKRTATTAIIGVAAPDIILSGDAEVRVCFGDSGGPGLLTIDEVEYVAGVHSYTTGEGCSAPNGDTRVDLHAEEFVLPWIQDNDPVCGADGLCGPVGCTADPDCEPCGRDGGCTDGCALPDPDCATSELGEICQADTQCTTGLCVFWQDDVEFHFCSEPCEPGGDGCPTGMSCQNIQPFGDVCYFDAAPPGVLGDACEAATDCGSYVCDDGQCVYACDLSIGLDCPADFTCEGDDSGAFYCRPVPDAGGCGCRTSSPGATLGGALLALLLLAIRRSAARSAR